jgi:endonuclease-3
MPRESLKNKIARTA